MVGRSDEHNRGRDVYGVPEGSAGKLPGWDSSRDSMSSVPQYPSQGVPVVPQSGVSQGVPMPAASYGGSVSASQVPSGSENRPVPPQGVPPVPPQGVRSGQRKRPVVLIVLAVVLVVVLVVVGVLGVLVWQKEKAEDAAYGEAHQPYVVDIAVNAAGWDEDSSSPIPLRITGKDLDGKPVEREVLYSGGDTGIELLRGDYEVVVPASPVLEDGNIFRVPAKPIGLSITADTPRHSSVKAVDSVSSGKAGADSGAGDSEAAGDGKARGSSDGKGKSGDGEARDSAGGAGSLVEVSLEPVPAEDVTDDQIAQIEEVFSEFGMDAAQVKEWTQAVSECRQARLDQIAAEEKAAAQAVEEAKKQQAIDQARAAGKQVLSGTVRIMSAQELAAFQGKYSDLASTLYPDSAEFAILVFDTPAQVTARLSGDAGRLDSRSASMLGLNGAGSKPVDPWRQYNGQHITVAIAASDMWWQSDVSLPMDEPRSEESPDSIILF